MPMNRGLQRILPVVQDGERCSGETITHYLSMAMQSLWRLHLLHRDLY